MKKYHIWLNPLMAVIITISSIGSLALAQGAFSDLSSSHPNYAAVMELRKQGIIGGYPDGTFKTERTVNRVEALKMIILTAKKVQKLQGTSPKEGKATFGDVDQNAWYMPTLEQAVSYDIVSGYPDGLFRPEKTVNLVESLKMALKAFEIDLSKLTVLENPYADAFKDQWYAKYVEYAKRTSIIDSDDEWYTKYKENKIYPDQGMKRGTLAEVLYRLLLQFQTITETDTTVPPLKTLAEKRGVRFGAFYNYDRRGPRHDQIFEKEMKAMTIYFPWSFAPGSNNDGVDALDLLSYDEQVAWGKARNMEIYGQSMVWFEELPAWFKTAPNADIEGFMNRHIDTLMGRYKGRIKFWNVANEAVNDAGALRQNHKWAEALGDDYIRKAFIRAHAADSEAVLYYNDFDIESNEAKFKGVKNLLIDLKKQGAPVHALGWQMHVKPDTFNSATLIARMNEIADLGFDNYITELDVELPENAAATDFERQKQTYKKVVQAFLATRRPELQGEKLDPRILVTWGIHDNDSGWLTKFHPFLWDEYFNKKPAYFGVQDALK